METEMQSTSPPLPQELVDYIIDILTYDIPTLRSVFPSHEHLFREVDIGTRHLRQSFRDISHVVKSLIGVGPGEEGGVPPYLILQSLPRLEKIAITCTEWNSMGLIFWETVSSLTHLRSLTVELAPSFPRCAPYVPWCQLAWRSYVSLTPSLRVARLAGTDDHETRVRSLTCKGKFRAVEYEFVMALCPALANTAHSIDITLYSRHHILQMQEQLSKGILRNITVLHIPRDAHIHDDLPILRMSRLHSISVQLWDHHSKPEMNAGLPDLGLPDLGLLEWWIRNFEHWKNSDIQHITFRVCYDDEYARLDDYSVWKKLDKACAAMSSLCSLEIVVMIAEYVDPGYKITLAHGVRAIKDQLTLSAQRGIVSVSEK
ncbi:hypothetical protein EV421DRAFT_1785625 [Armillaria borealis]|uniref:Uncharacterized protein n=1 Tax=Armillaria borealis TaxID=47425 RepID=A0AA39JSL8_9AGAR|nr:hypothetical protein EV421DRAFT_1785625 [Armillaria borealis]